MLKENFSYQCDHTPCTGFFASDSSSNEKKPLVLIVPTWFGMNDFAKDWAVTIAKLGYSALACDIFGNGACAKDEKEAGAFIAPLFMDRALLRKRLQSAYEAALKHPSVNSEKVGIMGFCFGGLSAIEFLRSGAPLKATISVHAVLNDTYEGKSVAIPHGGKLNGSLLILTGAKDPLAPLSSIELVQKEMTEAAVDWQTHIFGSAAHSFTNKDATHPEKGFNYDALADQRSRFLIEQFFKERFT